MISTNTYKLYLMMCDEIKRHKWIESEKVGKDIGFENALTDWMQKHRRGWCDERINYGHSEKKFY